MANLAKKSKKNPKQIAFTRFMLIVAFFVLWIGGIGARLVHLQINQHEDLRGKALNQRRDKFTEKQLRGTIYDRDDHPLAMSVKVKSLVADPSEIENIDSTAKQIAKVLNVKPELILKPLKEGKERNKRFVFLARKLDESAVKNINDAFETADLKKNDLPKFAGLHWREEQKRTYTQGANLGSVIGFSNAEDVGSAGIEQSQETHLHGAIIKTWRDRDRYGRVYDEEEVEREAPKDVVLTISRSIQYKVEQALAKGVKASNAKSGIAIAMNPKTGEILAMANYPSFDPNRYNEFPQETYTNRAVQSMYAPGSVFKIIAFGGALNEGLIQSNGEINCGSGVIKMNGRNDIVDKHCHQTITYTDALAVSSNYATIKTAQLLGNERFFDYSQRFGFGTTTGIELPAEARGTVHSPKNWNSDSLASMSIGYEVNVTALQAISAYSAIANNGVRVTPHLIKEIRQDGKVISTTEAESNTVMTVETAKSLRRMLEKVVQSGTAKRAKLNGFTSAGKTGTAWKYSETLKKYDENKYVSSFIGFAPAENPEIVIAVVVDEPQGGARDGGQVSAPIFREIAESVLPELNVKPDANIKNETASDEEIPTETEATTAKTDKKAVGNKKTEVKKEEKESSTQKPKETATQKPKIETKNKSSGK